MPKTSFGDLTRKVGAKQHLTSESLKGCFCLLLGLHAHLQKEIFPAKTGNRYRPKGVLGKGVGNNKNASEMRQKCVKMGLALLGNEERSKMRQTCVKPASEVRQECAEQNTFGGEHLLDDTERIGLTKENGKKIRKKKKNDPKRVRKL